MIKPKIKGYKVCLKIDVWRRVWAEFEPKQASELLPLDVAPRVRAAPLVRNDLTRRRYQPNSAVTNQIAVSNNLPYAATAAWFDMKPDTWYKINIMKLLHV